MRQTQMWELLAAMLLALPFAYAAEGDQAAGQGGAAAPGAGQAGGQGGGPGGGRRGGRGGMPGGGGGGMDMGALAGAIGGGGQMRNMVGMASRMLGIDLEDPKAGPKMDALPFGADKRFVFNVPVGGVDNPSGTGQGWKMEVVFKMTDEQTKSVEALREEYLAEQKKVEKEIQDQYKLLGDKVKALRTKYELRANDILTGEDKTRKEKMDALAKETNTKNTEIIAETLPLYDLNDWQQSIAMVRAIRERMNKQNLAAEGKLLELIPPESKEKMEGAIKQQAEQRDQTTRFMNFRGPGGAGGAGGRGVGGAHGDEPVKPPRPPEADKKADF